MQLWAEGVRRARTTDRMKVIEALGSGISIDGPPGKTTLDPKTNHVTLDVYVAEVKNRGFNVLQHFPNSLPADTQSVCDLQKEPNANRQVVVDVRI